MIVLGSFRIEMSGILLLKDKFTELKSTAGLDANRRCFLGCLLSVISHELILDRID